MHNGHHFPALDGIIYQDLGSLGVSLKFGDFAQQSWDFCFR